MAILNDIERRDILKLTELLKKILPNKELLELFLNYLQPVSEKITKTIIITPTQVAFKYPNGDYYMLNIDNDGINSFYNQKSIGSVQRIKISFLQNLTFVTNDETISEIDEFTEEPSFIIRHTDCKTYKDNEIVYHRVYKTKTSNTTNTQECSTISQEIYVNDDRIAYMRSMTITNDELNVPEVTYSKCCSYNPAPFNNLINTEKRDEPFIYPSNENEFTTSIAEINKGKTK